MNRNWRVAGINFSHMHMGDLLREVFEHPHADIVGICDRNLSSMAGAAATFSLSAAQVFTDSADCIRTTRPDLLILCPATADHAAAFAEVAPFGVDVLIEKPFAASLADADRMIAAALSAGIRFAINWPLRWYPPHVTTKRLIDAGAIGEVLEVHFYDGNRGPLHHLADKAVVTEDEVNRAKPTSWWYQAAAGGGSLNDYLGYGATLGTWYMNGRAPIDVTCVIDQSPGIDVDEHSITICRYATGLSKFETRWGTISDPWTTQPQPKCGFVVVGSTGSISSYDFEAVVGLQTRQQPIVQFIPVDTLTFPDRKPIEHVLSCKEKGVAVSGPLDPALCRTAQRIVDTAMLSARQKQTLELLA